MTGRELFGRAVPVFLGMMLVSACATGGGQAKFTAQSDVNNQQNGFSAASLARLDQHQKQQDRSAILAMAGDYEVTFDFEEKVSFVAGYKLKDPKVSGAHEIVRVIEDNPDFISLQHILIVGDGMTVKHWRQDWAYEPEILMEYQGFNSWQQVKVAPEVRSGAWSQTVYQVDDAPRYAGVGRWTHSDGASIWESASTLRPLPRRDATTRDDYHAIRAVNRHAITPEGWVHEQDNQKLVFSEGETVLLAHEVGVNTYTKSTKLDASHAMEYWNNTKDYWSEIRNLWTKAAQSSTGFVGLTIEGEPEALYMPIMALAEEYGAGKIKLEDAVIEAKRVFDQHTVTRRADSLIAAKGR